MLVRKVEVLLPIVGGDVVLAGADVVADSSMNGLVNGWLLDGAELVAEQLVYRFRTESG